jgi:sugar/nucleoside kinase (ribokinase family)
VLAGIGLAEVPEHLGEVVLLQADTHPRAVPLRHGERAGFDEGGIRWVANPALEVARVVDATGCGDSFSAGFMWSYLCSRNPVKANAAANIVAGINCTISGIGHLEAARDALAQIPAAFPDLGPKIMSGWPGEKL